MSCNCEGIIIEVPREGIDGNGIANIELLSESGLEKTYRINFTNGEYFDYVVTDGSSIASIAKTGTQILVDTYTVTLTDGNTTTFQVTNGRSVVSIAKTNTEVLTDTYTISYNDNTTSTFQVVNGNGIVSIEKTNTDVLVDTYTITLSNNTTVTYQVVNGRGITSITKVGSADLVDTYRILFNDNTYTDYTVTNGEKGDTGTGIVSITKTGSLGLVDTYTVLLSDNTSYTFTVTNGEKGDSATIAIGTVTTGAEGSSASVTNRGDEHDAIWDITIPRGNTGNGIASISLLSTSGLTKTYRITYTNGTHFDFSVSDGNGIASIEKTATVGAVDTYTVTFTDPTAEPFEYTVTNGSDEWGAIVGDIADQTDLQQALDTKAPAIVESASGDLVTFEDGAGLPVESLSVSVEAVQDLHGYDAPWPAGGGKNKYSDVFSDFTKPTDYYVCPITLTEGKWVMSISLAGTQMTGCVVGIVQSGTRYSDFVGQRNVLGTAGNIGNQIMTVNSDWTDPHLIIYCTGETQFNQIFANYHIQLEKSETATSYAPYANICPISGWDTVNVPRTGVNVWGGEKMADDMVLAVNNATYCTKGTDTDGNYVMLSASSAMMNKVLSNNTKFKPNTQYTIVLKAKKSNTNDSTNLLFIYTDGTSEQIRLNNGTAITANTIYNNAIVSSSGKSIKEIQSFWGSGVAYLYYGSCGIFEGVHTADEFVPYNGTTVTIDLDGTRYGGTLDVGTGTMVVDRTGVDIGSLAWVHHAPSGSVAYDYFQITLGDAVPQAQASGKADIITSVYPVETAANIAKEGYDNCIAQSGNVFFIADSSYTDATTFKNAVTGQTLVYYLKYPITITGLTPAIMRTLLGYNAIWADCGAVDVQYRADTKLFVENTVAEANATTRKMIADTANGNLAPKSLDSGDLIIVGEELRKCTANIGSGSAITDSNSTVANLADVIKALQ